MQYAVCSRFADQARDSPLGVKVLDLSGKVGGEAGRIKARDRGHPTLPIQQPAVQAQHGSQVLNSLCCLLCVPGTAGAAIQGQVWLLHGKVNTRR